MDNGIHTYQNGVHCWGHTIYPCALDRCLRYVNHAKMSKHVFWLYGLSGAGKTTLASALVNRLKDAGCPTLILDGDALRSGLCRDLGFTQEDRLENVRRAAELARLLSEQGYVVLVALMAPHERMRQLARSIVGESFFHEVYLSCDYATCSARDPKGLYAKAAAGEVNQFPGKDMVFEEPQNPDLVLQTDIKSVEDCVETLLAMMLQETN